MSSWVYLSDAQCADPRTPPEDISAFINGNWPMLHPERMALLAANPSTPVVDLATLAVDHADIVLKNPGFRLQLANDPAILDLANANNGMILTLEDNYGGGIGSAIADAASEDGGGFSVNQMHVRRIPKSGRTPEDVMAYCGLGVKDIVQQAMALLELSTA